MKSFFRLCWLGFRRACASVFSILLWTLWLLLAVILAGQLWSLTSHQFALPGFVLSALEERLAASGLKATFGKTLFDPSGRILVEDARLLAPSFQEPLATARAAYVRIDPWALLAGRFEPREFQFSGVSLFVPAMLSASGRAEPLVSDLDVTILPGEHEVQVPQLTTRLGRLVVTAHGAVHTAVWQHERGAPIPIADFIAHDYPRLSRQVADYAARLALLDEPQLDLELSPSETRGAIVTASLFARSLKLSEPLALEATNLTATTRFPAAGETVVKTQLELSAGEVRLPHAATISDLHAHLRGTLRPEQRAFDPEEADVRATRVAAAGLTAAPFTLQATRHDSPLRVALLTEIAGTPAAVSGETDLTQKSAKFDVDVRPTAALLAALTPLAKRDLAELIQLSAPPAITAHVELGADWKLERVDANLAAHHLVARGVPLDAVSGRLRFAGTDFQANDILLRVGESEARGTYTMDTASQDYRFLLQGRLRPAAIDPWFHEWWPHFFRNFDFSAAPPVADVDVLGRWGDPRLSAVFIQVDAVSPVVRSVPFDEVHTRLFIRPDFYDALDLLVTRGSGSARGTFTRRVDLEKDAFRDMDFAVTSTLEVQEGARIFGQSGLEIVEPFRFATPPRLRIEGHIDGPAAADGEHQKVHIEGQSTGAFSLFDFPLSDLSFTADLNDNDLRLPRVAVTFAGGSGSGAVHLSGHEPDRRLDFDYQLKNANLAQSVITLENFLAQRRKEPPPPKSEFLEKAGDVSLDLTLAANGQYQDAYSFQGKGHAEIAGSELGQVRLLGLLSELLNFTSLRFTKAQGDFQLDGKKLMFPDLKLTGANSQIDAKGAYDLDESALDFNAKVYPLGESKFLVPQIFNAVLTPLSEILEVKLTGSLKKPQWSFVHSPASFFRNLNNPTDKGGNPAASGPDNPPAPGKGAEGTDEKNPPPVIPTPPASAHPGL
jgi:hypothetical protein